MSLVVACAEVSEHFLSEKSEKRIDENSQTNSW